MGFFNKLFKTEREIADEEIVEIPWHMLTSETSLDKLEKESESKLLVIFKHSTRCGISRMVLRNFEKNLGLPEEKSKLYFLDILNNREVSQEIASHFQVMHESPQLIVLKNREVIYHASHSGISASKLKDFAF
jgi:bacillithiol system protein YtxJ